MLKAEQIPAEVRAVFQKACDSGEPWNIADTIAAAINAWPGVRWNRRNMVTRQKFSSSPSRRTPMTDPRDELRDKVAIAIDTAICTGDQSSVAMELTSEEIKTLADAAIAMALEEAAKLAEAKADEWATVWRNRFKTDSHMEGKSDGADEIAAAIRAMIKENSND